PWRSAGQNAEQRERCHMRGPPGVRTVCSSRRVTYASTSCWACRIKTQFTRNRAQTLTLPLQALTGLGPTFAANVLVSVDESAGDPALVPTRPPRSRPGRALLGYLSARRPHQDAFMRSGLLRISNFLISCCQKCRRRCGVLFNECQEKIDAP